LLGRADELTIHFPWGSLLRGVLGHDDAVLSGIAALLAPGAPATVLLSLVARDGAPELRAGAYARCGLALPEARPATSAEVAASRSTWAKKLRAGTAARPVTRLTTALSADAGRRTA
jgi:16S rRNA (adenine(1408)-N(1))-methyltransferase